MRSDCKFARTNAHRSSLIVNPFFKGVQEFRSDDSLRSVDVCLTSNLSSLISHPSSFNAHRSSFLSLPLFSLFPLLILAVSNSFITFAV